MWNKVVSPRSRLLMGAAAAGALLCGLVGTSAAVAQDSYDANEQIIVQAPAVHSHFNARPQVGAVNDFTISVSRAVNYGDLDLMRDSDRDILRHRITEAALLDCQQLDREYSVASYPRLDSDECVQTASNDAMARVMNVSY